MLPVPAFLVRVSLLAISVLLLLSPLEAIKLSVRSLRINISGPPTQFEPNSLESEVVVTSEGEPFPLLSRPVEITVRNVSEQEQQLALMADTSQQIEIATIPKMLFQTPLLRSGEEVSTTLPALKPGTYTYQTLNPQVSGDKPIGVLLVRPRQPSQDELAYFYFCLTIGVVFLLSIASALMYVFRRLSKRSKAGNV